MGAARLPGRSALGKGVEMPWWGWVLIVVAVLLVLLIVWWIVRRRRSERLRERFGPEYDRTLADAGKRRRAEAELQERERRRTRLDIRPLQPAARDRYVQSWRAVQERFVDTPDGAVAEADRLVIEVMRERGYPIEDFEQRAADVSVDHPVVVDNYRAAHAISVARQSGEAGTEDLRQAMVHYRALFEELLETR